MTKEQLIKNIKKFAEMQVNNMANTNKPIGFFKPVIIPVLNKNIDKLNGYADIFTNKEGEIDLENIMNQLINNLEVMEPFTINVPVLQDVELGGGHVKVTLPIINKTVSFDMSDVENLRKTLFEQI